MKLRFLPSVSLQEVQPTHPAEIFLHHTALLPTKPMEEIARKNKEIEQIRTQLKMQIEESERKIQDLEAENQALKRQLFQEGEQLQHEIEENMPRKEYSLVGTVSMKEKECASEEVPQELRKPQKGIFILELEPECTYGQLTIFSKSETRSENVLFQHVKVFTVISFNPELRQDSMTGLVSCPYHWIIIS